MEIYLQNKALCSTTFKYINTLNAGMIQASHVRGRVQTMEKETSL